MTREAFEAWAGKRERYHTTSEWDAMNRAWQSATANERGRCAQTVEKLNKAHWFNKQSEFAEFVANAIRNGE